MRKHLILLSLIISFGLIGGQGMAQDNGEPAMKTVTYYTYGGAAAGAVIGAMYFLVDPLGPTADFRGSVLTGAGVGTIAGLILGILQLNRQAVMPGYQIEDENEFLEGKHEMHDPTSLVGDQIAFQYHFPSNDLGYSQPLLNKGKKEIPIVNFGFQF